jgi:hypothetical protein
MDPETARDVWQDGWRTAKLHDREVDIPRAWNRGFLMGILTALLALLLSAVL